MHPIEELDPICRSFTGERSPLRRVRPSVDSLTQAPYYEYHTSGEDLSFVRSEALAVQGAGA
jgi:aminopeptidase-like protein